MFGAILAHQFGPQVIEFLERDGVDSGRGHVPRGQLEAVVRGSFSVVIETAKASPSMAVSVEGKSSDARPLVIETDVERSNV